MTAMALRRLIVLLAIVASTLVGSGNVSAHPTIALHPAHTTVALQPTHASAALCRSGYYKNVSGHCVRRPSSDPSGATAKCRDGTYSYSEHASGTCSHHGGVSRWNHHP